MKMRILKVSPFGDGGHVVMRKSEVGKEFIILPEKSKHLISLILNQMDKSLKDITSIRLSEVLSGDDMDTIKKTYLRKAKNVHNRIHIGLLESHLMELLPDKEIGFVGIILDDLEQELPIALRKKLLRLYYSYKE